MRHSRFFAFAVWAALLTACAAAPERIEQLEQARVQVQQLSQDPRASQAASRELASARDALRRAEVAQEEGEPVEQITHLAYLAQRQAETGMARIQEMQARERVAQAEAERNRVLLQARSREIERAEQRALTAEAEAARATQELQDLQARKTKRGMVMTLSDVLFETDSADLAPGAMRTINRLAEYLNDNEGTRIIIEGHTDSRGSEEHNRQLSQRRAQAVADALVSRGVPSDRFEVIGRGEQLPVASNATAAGRQQNRRVEIIFSDPSGRFASGESVGTLR